MEPLISIIVPCYNQAQYLEECLTSILNQSYTNWECIIINDGSSDHTNDMANAWVNKDARFRYINKKNEGVSKARNEGIAKSKGVFILPLDADDKLETDYIKLGIKAFQQDGSLKIVYCKANFFGNQVGEWSLKPFSLKNLAKGNIIFCSAIYKKTDWAQVGGYDENMVHGLEDWEFWISILKNEGHVLQLDYYGFFYRIKENSRNTQMLEEKRRLLYEYISIKHADFIVKQLGSYIFLNSEYEEKARALNTKLKSKKFIVNIFFEKFLGFKPFKLK